MSYSDAEIGWIENQLKTARIKWHLKFFDDYDFESVFE